METFCEDDKILEEKWMKFQEKVKKYCERRVIDCPEDMYGEDDKLITRETVVMKVDRNWISIKVSQLFQIRDSVARVLGIKPLCLYLRTVENGCIKLLFYVPQSVIYDISPATKKELEKLGVVSLVHSPDSAVAMQGRQSIKRRRLSVKSELAVMPTIHRGIFHHSIELILLANNVISLMQVLLKLHVLLFH